MKDNALITVPQIAEQFKVRPKTVHNWVRIGHTSCIFWRVRDIRRPDNGVGPNKTSQKETR